METAQSSTAEAGRLWREGVSIVGLELRSGVGVGVGVGGRGHGWWGNDNIVMVFFWVKSSFFFWLFVLVFLFASDQFYFILFFEVMFFLSDCGV